MEGVIIPTVKAMILRGRRVLILRRSATDPYGPGIWEFPGGQMEFGESLVKALRREVREETGLAIEIGPLLYTATPLIRADRQALVLNYLCTAGTEEVVLSHEHYDFLWATKAELCTMLEATILQNLLDNDVFSRLDIDE
ncbi:NUDIX domain-containing protein [Ruminococcaceae bacterium OttesenSCG-928-I18]|nr:NUDIX domain-containing protein [Ruminococcaceae bacterium OttesenSCG-928-I18]